MNQGPQQAFRLACATIAAEPNWALATGLAPCHPTTGDCLYYRVPRDGMALIVCIECLNSYVRTGDKLIGQGRQVPMMRRCSRCDQEAPAADFVARSGALTRFCGQCRTAWGKQKRAEAAAAEAAEAAAEEAALDGHVREAVHALLRIEQQLAE